MNIDFKNAPNTTSHLLSGSSLRNLWNLLVDNKFNIDREFWPKLLKSALIAFLNTPFALVEKILFSRRIKKTKVQAPVFILGYPRNGTTYLYYLLSKDPNFAFCKTYECMGPHVIFTFGPILRRIALSVLPIKRPMDNMALGADLPKEVEFATCNIGIESMSNGCFFPQKFSEYFDRFVLFKGPEKELQNWKKNYLWFLKKLTLKNKGKRLILKSPFNTGRIKILLELFPDAKFIFIRRHPYHVYSSNERLYEGILPNLAFHKIDNAEMEQHVFYTFRATIEQYLAQKKAIPEGHLFEVAYEDFFQNQEAIIRQFYQQLDLGNMDPVWPIFEKEISRYNNYKTNKYGLTKEIEEKVYREWKVAFDSFGYSE